MSATRRYEIRPLGVGDLIDHAIWLYRDQFVTLVSIAAIILVPAGVAQLILRLMAEQTESLGASLLLMLIGALIGFCAWLLAFTCITASASEALMTGESSVLSGFDRGVGRVPTLLVVVFAIGSVMALISMTIIGIPFAIFMGVSWIVAGQALVIENTGVSASLGRSWELTRGNRLRVFGLFLLIAVITIVISLLFNIPGFVAGAASTLGAGETALMRSIRIGAQFFSIAGDVLITPIQLCAWTLLYYDLRARKEGFDLELQLDEISIVPQATPGMD